MEELKDLLEQAKKANKSIDEGMKELNKLRSLIPKDTNPEAIQQINDSIAEINRLKEKLNEHQG